MAELKQFQATTKDYQITEAEALKLRNQLFALRKQYVLHIWEPQLELELPSMSKLEEAINDLEHKLAHAVITA